MSRTKSFWIYPEPDNKYWKVRVHVVPSQRALDNRWVANHRNHESCDSLGAFFRGWTVYEGSKKGKPLTKTGEFGAIYLNAESLFIGYITHECGHAAHRYCRQKRLTNYGRHGGGPLIGKAEEAYCYALGHMTEQIVAKLRVDGYDFTKP